MNEAGKAKSNLMKQRYETQVPKCSMCKKVYLVSRKAQKQGLCANCLKISVKVEQLHANLSATLARISTIPITDMHQVELDYQKRDQDDDQK